MATELGPCSPEECAFLLGLTSMLLSAPLSVEDRSRRLVERIVPDVADLAAVIVGSESGRLAAVEPDVTLDPETWRQLGQLGPGLDADAPAIVIRRGDARAQARPELASLLERADLAFVSVADLASHDGRLGALVLGFRAPRTEAAATSRHVGDVARLAAFALEKASLYGEMERARRARDEIIAIVAHDLRNPLTTARLAAARLETSEDPARRGELMGVVVRSVERALTLVEDLLDAEVVESGQLSLVRSAQSVATLVADAQTLLRPIVVAAGLTLAAQVEPDVGEIWCDPKRVLQVFSNLIGNAVKFTPHGGVVTLRATRAADVVRFEIADTGCGIPPEILPRIFDRYYQVRPGVRRGAGLGLPIAKAIVQQHGGTMEVVSTVGQGTTFRFTLPAAPGAGDG